MTTKQQQEGKGIILKISRFEAPDGQQKQEQHDERHLAGGDQSGQGWWWTRQRGLPDMPGPREGEGGRGWPLTGPTQSPTVPLLARTQPSAHPPAVRAVGPSLKLSWPGLRACPLVPLAPSYFVEWRRFGWPAAQMSSTTIKMMP